MEVTINGLKIQIEGAGDPQVYFDQDTQTVKIQVKQKVIEKIKVVEIKGKDTVKYVPTPPIVVSPPWPPKPYYPWDNWHKWQIVPATNTRT